MPDLENRFHPIIYVRGYAMTQGEIDDTTADPFCGFNLGSTVFRATSNKKQTNKFIFESPVIRLGTDFGYKDIFDNGLDIMDTDWNGSISSRSIIVYHYYDQASTLLGSGETPDIRKFAEGLGQLILRVRDVVCQVPDNKTRQENFRCYLVAHSMGGLICRAFLQNPDFDKNGAKRYVDKVFTYATPHNGIEVGGFNIPKWLSVFGIDTFNREKMFKYLNLKKYYEKTKRVDWLPKESFPSEKFFCMIGTNRNDYEVAMGLSRTFAGHGSDGLVRIANASVWGIDDKGEVQTPCATAYAYRSHSGYFGIVNSEESYQNLIRFLFGDLRADIWVDVSDIRLPEAVQKEADGGKDVNALYQFEILASPRGKRWYLTRRTAEEDSVACRSHKDLTTMKDRSIYLSSVFLGKNWRTDKDRPSLAYSVTLGVRVPDYEVDQKFWFDTHYEGGYLFRDSVIIEITPPQRDDEDWVVTHDWQSDNLGQASRPLNPKELENGRIELTIPFYSNTTPGVDGILRFVVSKWNC